MRSDKFLFLFIGFLLFHFTLYSQTQLGPDLVGEAFEDQFGTAMALSDDGTIVAVAAKENDEAASNAGHVRVYQWTGTDWMQLGMDLDGVGPSDRLGTSVALAADGWTVACGAPENGAPKGYVVVRVWDGTAWIPKGEPIEGVNISDRFGTSVALTDNGDRLAVGAVFHDTNGSNAGQVTVYDWTGTDWVQVGPSLYGEDTGDNAGSAVSLSADGTRLAVGASDSDVNGTKSGRVWVYEWTPDSTWTLLGEPLDGEDERDEFGTHVRLSTDGKRLAVGAPFNDGNGTWSGHVRVFEWAENRWVKLGQDLDGEGDFDRAGYSVDLGANGNRVIIGAINNGDNGAQAGHARVFEWSGSRWIQIGLDIDGDQSQDLLGFSVAIAENGETVAVGAPINGNAFAENAGYARVFALPDGLSTSLSILPTGRLLLFPNPVEDWLFIDLVDTPGQQLELTVFAADGRPVLHQTLVSRTPFSLAVGDLLPGFYTVTISAHQFLQTRKFLKR